MRDCCVDATRAGEPWRQLSAWQWQHLRDARAARQAIANSRRLRAS